MRNVGIENISRVAIKLGDLTINRYSYGISIWLREFQCDVGIWNRVGQEQTRNRCEYNCVTYCHTWSVVYPGTESAFHSLHPGGFPLEWGWVNDTPQHTRTLGSHKGNWPKRSLFFTWNQYVKVTHWEADTYLHKYITICILVHWLTWWEQQIVKSM